MPGHQTGHRYGVFVAAYNQYGTGIPGGADWDVMYVVSPYENVHVLGEGGKRGAVPRAHINFSLFTPEISSRLSIFT